MASNLLKKLSFMGQTSAPKPAPPQSHVKIYTQAYPLAEGIRNLNKDALYMMGFRGGELDISKAAFIDTETTGLSGGAGTVAFLVGVGYVEGDCFIVKQYLMPDYSCEVEMLNQLSRDLSVFDTVVHFNGRRFDMPLLSTRCVLKRIDDFTQNMEQLDLLYPARAVWKLRLGSCRLSYIETKILGMSERDDIPGGEIPAKYFEAVRSGDISLLDEVIKHNRQDIVTMMYLLKRLEQAYAKPEDEDMQLDIFSLGKAFERQGEYRVAKNLFLKASKPRAVLSAQDLKHEKYAGEANLRLYLLQRRNREYDKCVQTLNNMIKRGQMDKTPRLELSKLYEHRLGELDKALNECEILISKASEEELPALIKRKTRLTNKLKARNNKCK